MKKNGFKKFLKKQWKWLVTGGFFLISGLVVMLIGFTMTGWSLIEWIKSPYATTVLIIMLIGGVLLLLLLVEMKRRRLGDDD
ncbi:MAG: hypothetical protein WC994_10165 [Brumimicrobium sp.]|jgi:hypothetical protein